MCDEEVTQGPKTQVGMDTYLESATWHYTECRLPNSPYIREDLGDWLSVGPLSQNGGTSVDRRIQLEELQTLWQKFMTSHSHFHDWLQLAEKSTTSPNSSHVCYVTAKQELKKFETLRSESRARLAQLDGLTQQQRVLTQRIGGPVGRRLAGMVRDCSQRWDLVSEAVDSICLRLKLSVSQREEFENQREEMAIWLADMNLRLTEVEHFSGKDNQEKMRQLQNFQDAVGENTVRLNNLLEQGEALIEGSEPADAQDIEAGLQDLLLYCACVFEGVGQLHTRLLSMRLVFEEDWLLAPPPDSGCPSEVPAEEEDFAERGSLAHLQGPLALPGSDHQALEWDPSVDVGGSVSFDDADSSYFSAITGLHYTEESTSKHAKRRSYLSSNGSRSDMTTDGTPDMSTDGNAECASPITFAQTLAPGTKEEDNLHLSPQKTSTSGKHLPDHVTFDPERISTWLGHIPVIHERKPCSRAQTEDNQELVTSSITGSVPTLRRPWPSPSIEECRTPCPPLLGDCEPLPAGLSCRRHANPQPPEKKPDQQGASLQAVVDIEQRHDEAPVWRKGSGPRLQGPLRASVLLYVLMALLLALFLWLLPGAHGPSCHYGNTLNRSFHLMLRYVNGPPPT
ncbi:nesprin-2 isoform X1 [Conger conger]|uniref:nesprin-2 isoform X1 n=1 Tax=Conger conger TaxID=82655 RepID=UPI002A59A460|nr:nesprin-2 isoform X1 [Conger conger]XP_061073452.1 nesprin-2 isoform X1 [Conger conger]